MTHSTTSAPTPCQPDEATYPDWYHSNRCPESPTNPMRALNLARRIWEPDFGEDIDLDEVESTVIEVLGQCFCQFDPKKGREGTSAEARFMTYYRSCLRRRFKDRLRDRESRRRRRSVARYADWKRALDRATPSEDPFQSWMWRLYEEAVQRLDHEAREYVRLHIVAELSLEETARVLGVSRSHLRRFGGGRLPALVRDTITRMVLQMTPGDLAGVVHAMDSAGLLDEEEMSRLLCVPVEVVVDSLKGRVDRREACGTPDRLGRAG